MKATLKDLTDEEILRWVEWKDADIQYDLFDQAKLSEFNTSVTKATE